MDFEHERSVLLFTRDTATWAVWKWQARCVFPLLLRVVKNDGRITWDGDESPAKAISLVIRVPTAIVEVALAAMVETQTVEVRQGLVRIVKFVEAQQTNGAITPRGKRTGSIYLARSGQRVKIGFSKNPWARLAELRIGSALPIEIVAAFPGTPSDENALHHRFAASRAHGEWFRMSPEVSDFVSEMAERHPPTRRSDRSTTRSQSVVDRSSTVATDTSFPPVSPLTLSPLNPLPTNQQQHPYSPQKTAQIEIEPAFVAPSLTVGGPTASPANDLPGDESPAMLLATASTPKRGGGRRGKPRAALPDGFALSAYETFCAARVELTGRAPRGLTGEMVDALSKLYAACQPSLEDWAGAVRVRLAMDKRGEQYGSLTWASLTAPANFERWLLESQKTGDQRHRPQGRAPVSSKPTTSGVVDLRELFGKRDAT